MRVSSLVLGWQLALAYVSASPLLVGRQEESPTPGTVPSTVRAESPVASSIPTPPPSEEITPTIQSIPPITSPDSTPGSPSPSPLPEPEVDDCPPCEDEPLFTSESPSGKVCYCLGGGERGKNNGDKAPWSWGLPSCQYGSDGAGLTPSSEDKPQVCTGNGAIPASRDCLNSCNFMLTTINSENPCSGNVVNAANACARCKGANMFVQTGKDTTGTYMNGEEVAKKLIDGLQDWCAKPERCYDLRGGKKISGQNGCPVLAVNNPVSPAPSIVTTSTRSFTDSNGQPTFALELLTIEDPNFTANTEFAGSRPTTAAGNGGTCPRQILSLISCFASLLAVLVVLA